MRTWNNNKVPSEWLTYDHETGLIVWTKTGEPALRTLRKDGYLHGKFNGKLVLAHRMIWFLCYGVWPVNEIDHVNKNRADNRLCNLRDVTHAFNMQNRGS